MRLSAMELLDDGLLERFDLRASVYDRENRFFREDFDELRAARYLELALPEERGGLGGDLAEFVACQRRLASVAPSTAVAVNMHLYWVGAAADMARLGDTRTEFVLDRAAAGDVFAAGHAEAGNDVPGLFSTTPATRVHGGWQVKGHKLFGSLSPVWDKMGLHAMDTSDPIAPVVIHAFVDRAADGIRVKETWDSLGMRASASHDTYLDDVFIPDDQVVVTCPAGFAGADLFHLTVFGWAFLGFAAVYLGVAERAFRIAVAEASSKGSIALTRPMAYHPEVQHRVADMRIRLEAASALLERTSADWVGGVDHGMDWLTKFVVTKHFVVENAWRVVDAALDVVGGAGLSKRHRLEQLFRDSRLGLIHPPNPLFTHEVVGKLSLGINPDEVPRWG